MDTESPLGAPIGTLPHHLLSADDADLNKLLENQAGIPDLQQDAVMVRGDGDLQQLIDAWPNLDLAIKVKIMGLLRKKK